MSETDSLTIGLIGYGEAGRTFAAHWSAMPGVTVKAFDMVFTGASVPEAIRESLEATGTLACGSMAELFDGVDVILSLVTPAAARVVAESAAKEQIGENAVFVDLNTVPPTHKMACAELFAQPDCYVDGAILDSFQSRGAQVPIRLAGPRAEIAAERLRRAGLNILGASEKLGSASAVKMCRSIYAKGAECLFVEALAAADAFGCGDAVLESIQESITSTPFMDWVTMLVTTHAIHAGRRSHEMAQIVEVLEGLGMPPIMTEASRDRLVASADMGLAEAFDHRVPESVDQVIEAIKKQA